MTILKRKVKRSRREDSQFIGMYMQKRVASYFSLYCLSIGMTKTHVLKSIIIDWMENMRVNLPREIIISNLAHKAFETWNNSEGKRCEFNTFINELKIELKFKGLEEYADEITSLVKDEKNKNK